MVGRRGLLRAGPSLLPFYFFEALPLLKIFEGRRRMGRRGFEPLKDKSARFQVSATVTLADIR